MSTRIYIRTELVLPVLRENGFLKKGNEISFKARDVDSKMLLELAV